MSKSDAFITVTCDSCHCEEDIQLCATARGGYDERYVDDQLKEMGWSVGANDYCPECIADMEVEAQT